MPRTRFKNKGRSTTPVGTIKKQILTMPVNGNGNVNVSRYHQHQRESSGSTRYRQQWHHPTNKVSNRYQPSQQVQPRTTGHHHIPLTSEQRSTPTMNTTEQSSYTRHTHRLSVMLQAVTRTTTMPNKQRVGLPFTIPYQGSFNNTTARHQSTLPMFIMGCHLSGYRSLSTPEQYPMSLTMLQ